MDDSTITIKTEQVQTVRSQFSQPVIYFVYPRKTMPVSSTGNHCELNCAHCGGHYLGKMKSLEEALTRASASYTSYLVSGGYTRQGKIPHEKKYEQLVTLSRQGSLNLHTGLVNQDDARWVGAIADVVSFDFILDEHVIQNIYKLDKRPEDFIYSYRALKKHVRVVPHLCLGLGGGKLLEEHRALQVLKEEGADAISFIIFRPTPGTPLANHSPPSLDEIAQFFTEARITFPDTPLYLGCMRPGGSYRIALDSIALNAGINKIVHPAYPARHLAKKMNFNIKHSEECCAF